MMRMAPDSLIWLLRWGAWPQSMFLFSLENPLRQVAISAIEWAWWPRAVRCTLQIRVFRTASASERIQVVTRWQ
eukprot:1841361-Rhodomonas_salina.1